MQTKIGTFLAWASSQGITTPLKIQTDGSAYRSMVMPSDNPELMSEIETSNTVNLVKVPLESCIVAESSQELAEKLLAEKELGEKSKFHPWLEILPPIEDFHGMPRFWTPERREFVQQYDGGQLEDRMSVDKIRFDKTNDDWALAVVDSRSNFLPDGTYSISPMLDFFNHDCRVETSATVDDKKRLCLAISSKSFREEGFQSGADSKDFDSSPAGDWKDQLFGLFGGRPKEEASLQVASSTAQIRKADDEIFISYGDLHNLELLCNYGFVPESNPANTETFQVKMMRQAPAPFVVDERGEINNAFNQLSISDLRLNLASLEEIESLEPFSQGSKISDKNEVEVFALIAGELEEAKYNAGAGADLASEKGDILVKNYLRGREATLSAALKKLEAKFPEIFGM